MTHAFKMQSVARSHIGAIRAVNEDRVLNACNRGLWVVADGMGGHVRGDVAAQTVIAALTDLAASHGALTLDDIDVALGDANARVFALNAVSGRSGSTVAGLCVTGSDAMVFWAGDSRVYRHRDGILARLTHDHRVVQDLMDAGLIDARQARTHPSVTVVTRAVGASRTLEIGKRIDAVQDGDRYLVCSDGLSDLVDDLCLEVALGDSADKAASGLLDAALAAVGTDNISFVIVTVGEAYDRPAPIDARTIF